MEHLQRIHDFSQLKILADARRLAILRLLMAKSGTLSQLGQQLGESPARVRHHLKALENAGLVELVDTRVVRGFVEKYYRSTASAYVLQELILPASSKPITLVALGSHDLALELLSTHQSDMEILNLPVGSLEGLIALRQGTAQIAGCHLLDFESGEYNLPYVRHFFPDRSIRLITLAHREQGLIVAKGNPLGIRQLQDLVQPGVRFINRNPGSGTRLWMDQRLRQLEIPIGEINGYQKTRRTHTHIAEAIKRGEADVGLGLKAAAVHHNLDFVPLFQERYDLVIQEAQMENPHMLLLLDQLQSGDFRRLVNELAGYDTTHTGNTFES